MAYELAGPALKRDNYMLRGVEIMSLSARNKSKSDYVTIRAGIRHKGNTDWLNTFTTSKNDLEAGTSHTMWNGSPKRLRDGSFPVVEITKAGSPAALQGSSVTFRYTLDGSARGKRSAIVSAQTGDAALLSIAGQVSQSGLAERETQIQLADEAEAASGASGDAQNDYSTSTQVVSSTSYVDGSVSVTATMPAGATTAYVLISAFATHENASQLRVAISDGSSEVVEAWTVAPGAGDYKTTTICYAASITADTTYTLRFHKTVGSSNADVERQGISLILVGV